MPGVGMDATTTEGSGKFVGDPCSKDSRLRWYNAIHRRGGTRRAEKRCLKS